MCVSCRQGRFKASRQQQHVTSGAKIALGDQFRTSILLAPLQETIYADPSDPTKFFQQEDSTVKVCQHLAFWGI